MVIFVFCVIAFIYVATMFAVVELLSEDDGGLITEGIIFLILIQPLLLVTTISYLRTVFTNPGYVETPAFEKGEKKVKTRSFADASKIGYCPICKVEKPPRAHHCSECKRCVRRMDHHCVWVGNCVGEDNHRMFVQFLFWATVSLVVTLVIILVKMGTLEGFSDIFEENVASNILLLIAAFFVILFAPLTLALLILQIKLISKNMTTIELNYKDPNPFDKGISENWRKICGSSKILWFCPIKHKTRILDEEDQQHT